MLTNYDNLYNYCSNSDKTEHPTIYHVGKQIGNYLLILAIDNENHQIYKYSNEWLHLLTDYYNAKRECDVPHYERIIDDYREIIYNKKSTTNMNHKDKNVIPLSTSFSLGTVHGYAGIFCILDQYIRYKEKYKDYYLLVYINSQKGILDIINGFQNCGIIDREKIIYILQDTPYLFKSIKFLFNRWHMYPTHLNDSHTQFKLDIISNYLVTSKDSDNYDDRICIIKSSESQNLTYNGIVSKNKIDEFCNKYNLTFLEPMNMNEIELINKLYRAKVFVTSWGTAYFKNHVYLSSKCEKILILVIGDDFTKQYHSGYVPKQYRNATIEYIFLDDNCLDMPPDLSL